VALVVAVMLSLLAFAPAGSAVPSPPLRPSPAVPAVVTVGAAGHGRPIPAGFVGLSLEYRTILSYAGTDPQAINPVFVRLIHNLNWGQAPVLRIGGDSTDWTWWPIPRMSRPPGVTYNITPRWLSVARALAQATGLRYILGINLEADKPVVEAAEAHALISGVGRRYVAALELGNEPELYSRLAWYRTAQGVPVPGRPASYDFRAFTAEFSHFRQAFAGIPVAGPSSGNYWWLRQLPGFLDTDPSPGLVTVHSYWLNKCLTSPGLPGYPTVPNLLNPHPPSRLSQALAQYALLSHARHAPIRIDEMNSVTCGGQPGVSDVFASALWAVNALFESLADGIDGVNIHTFPGTANQLFGFTRVDGRWVATVRPEYYGLLMFSQAARPGARLVRVAQHNTGQIRVWATIGKYGYTRVMLINDSLLHSSSVLVRTQSPPEPAELERLLAPSAYAKSGITIDGQSFGPQTTTGVLAGLTSAVTLTPSASPGAAAPYAITLPAASAAMLTIAPQRHAVVRPAPRRAPGFG
jgi:hypothetical protein